MQISKSLKLEKAVSSEDMRPAMMQILIKDQKAIATNGNIMAIVKCKNTPDENGLLNPSTLLEARKIKKYDQINRGVLAKFEAKDIYINGSDLKETAFINLNGSEQILNGADFQRTKDIKFPDWESVIPTEPAKYSICLNAKLLYDLAQALGTEAVILEMTGTDKAIRVYCGNNPEKNHNFGLLMPCRLETQGDYKEKGLSEIELIPELKEKRDLEKRIENEIEALRTIRINALYPGRRIIDLNKRITERM